MYNYNICIYNYMLLGILYSTVLYIHMYSQKPKESEKIKTFLTNQNCDEISFIFKNEKQDVR